MVWCASVLHAFGVMFSVSAFVCVSPLGVDRLSCPGVVCLFLVCMCTWARVCLVGLARVCLVGAYGRRPDAGLVLPASPDMPPRVWRLCVFMCVLFCMRLVFAVV